MKRSLVTVAVIVAMIAGGWELARSQNQGMGMMGRGKGAASCPLAAQGGMMGMMGKGMSGGMGGGCPMMMPGVKVKVEKIKSGVTITLSSDNEKTASRLQKMAEIMRLQHELHEEMMQEGD